jgi:hypothetical protein
MNISKYKNTRPKLILEEYFSGKIEAWGQFEDPFGIVRKKFTCSIISKWDKNISTLTINESFIYDDGTKENRIWKLIKVNNNYYEGTTDNVIGVAKGITSGNTFHWKYKFQLSLYGRKTKVSFDDYMYLQDSNVIINKAKMKKFGITLGTVFLFFKKNA